MEKIICEERSDEGLRTFKDNICGTIRSKESGRDKRVIEVNRLGNIYGEDKGTGFAGNVWDDKGLCPTITTMQGGNREPMIVEDFYKNREPRAYDETAPTIRAEREGLKVIVVSRGRNPDNPSDQKQGIELEQRLEPNSEGICNTLTSVQKDNLVLEPAILTPKRTDYGKAIRKDYENGKIQESRHNMTELQPRNDGISNTLTTVQKDNLVLEPTVKIKQATKEGYIDCKLGGVADLSYPTSKTRRGKVQDNGDTCPTLTAMETGVCRIETPYRIRKLTPKECWRLMGFTDEDFHKAEEVNSNTHLYKQAGNSIVVKLLESIFKQML